MDNIEKKIYGIKRDIVFMYVAIIVLGVIFVLFPKASVVTMCYVIAGALILWGAARTAAYFKASRFNIFGSYGLVEGSILLIAGIAIIIKPEFLAGIFMSIIGVILIVDGILKVQYAVDLLRIKGQAWWIIALTALVMIIAGAVTIINPFESSVALMIFTGLFLIANGLSDLAAIIYISKRIKELKRRMEEGSFAGEFVE